jgi:hypothetical protein
MPDRILCLVPLHTQVHIGTLQDEGPSRANNNMIAYRMTVKGSEDLRVVQVLYYCRKRRKSSSVDEP